MVIKKIVVPGMNNQHDAGVVRNALKQVFGIDQVEITLHSQEATISYDETAVSFPDLAEALLEKGFEVRTEQGEIVESFHDQNIENTAGGKGHADEM